MSEEDLYGGDIYGEGDPGQDPYPVSTLRVGRPAQDTGVALRVNTNRQSAEQERRTADLEAKLRQAQLTAEKWQAMAQELLPGAPVDPSSFRQEVERLRKAEAELAALRPREAKLQTALAEKNLEILELRWRVAAARETTHPSLAQARQLLTDPAVAKEFARLRDEAEAKAQEVRRLQEELQAVNFSQESKAGRLLMAKCRALQDENEDMGRDLAEGHVHALERQLALAKTALEDMRRAYLQLEDVTQQLDGEAEDLQAQVFSLTQELRWHESQENQMRHNKGYGGGPAQKGGSFDGQQGGYGGPRRYGGTPPMKMGMNEGRRGGPPYEGDGKRPMRGNRT
ncbi:probable pre-mRNA-splicing regulator WTAP [Coccomyxa sp. Obi]|nr:probable pre-mRNA-splicing regulator WTAP [Coccomyxa sp. Obi]